MGSRHADYYEGWHRRHERARRAAGERAAKARALVPVLGRCLVQDFGAHGVVLVGSLAGAAQGFTYLSDIDLVVEGLPPDRFYEAGAKVERLAHPFRVDLIPAERARPGIRDAVAAGERVA